MIVTCEECTTQFQLDDARVPDGGVRVRCSRCKHAFFVKKVTNAGDSVERVVEQALDEASAAPPAPEPPDPLPEAADESPFDDNLEESDWEFNHDAPPEEDAAAGSEDVENMIDAYGLDEEDSSAPSGLDLDGPLVGDVEDEIDSLASAPGGGMPDGATPEPLTPSSLASPAGSGLEASPLGRSAQDDLLSPPDEAAESAGGGPVMPETDIRTSPAEDLAGTLGTELASDGSVELPAAVPGGAPQAELGSPENWDFFDEGEQSRSDGGIRVAIGHIGVTAGRPSRPPVEVDAEPSSAAIWLGRACHGLGWFVVTGLLVGAVYRLAVPRVDATAAAPSAMLAGAELSEVRGAWLESASGATLYVVSGRIRNGQASTITTGSRLFVQLLGADGAVIEDRGAALGLRMPAERLRTEAPDKLRSQLAMESRAMGWAPFEPGSSRSLLAVFAGLPERATRFQLVAEPIADTNTGLGEPDGVVPANEEPGLAFPAEAS